MTNLPMEIETDDLYEASFYVLNGGTFTGITFGKVQPNMRRKFGFSRKYIITLSGVEERFIRYWKDYRAIGNIRTFSNIRKNLKRKIRNLERKER